MAKVSKPALQACLGATISCGAEFGRDKDKEGAIAPAVRSLLELTTSVLPFNTVTVPSITYQVNQSHMSSNVVVDRSTNSESVHAHPPVPVQEEKAFEEDKHLEHVHTSSPNLAYDDNDEEPELHARTYFALTAMFFLNLVQVLALQGPPAVVSNSAT